MYAIQSLKNMGGRSFPGATETEQARVYKPSIESGRSTATKLGSLHSPSYRRNEKVFEISFEVLSRLRPLEVNLHVLAISIPMSMTSFSVDDRLCF